MELILAAVQPRSEWSVFIQLGVYIYTSGSAQLKVNLIVCILYLTILDTFVTKNIPSVQSYSGCPAQ